MARIKIQRTLVYEGEEEAVRNMISHSLPLGVIKKYGRDLTLQVSSHFEFPIDGNMSIVESEMTRG